MRKRRSSAYGCELELPLGDPVLTARFLAKVVKRDGHWFWIGRKNGGGYGEFKVNGCSRYAHRVSYALFVGIVPARKDVMHKTTCARTDCVNPGCLEVGTKRENQRERWQRYREASYAM